MNALKRFRRTFVPAATGGASIGQGLLIDEQGDDAFEDPTLPGGTCQDCTIIPKGVAGAQIDSEDLGL